MQNSVWFKLAAFPIAIYTAFYLFYHVHFDFWVLNWYGIPTLFFVIIALFKSLGLSIDAIIAIDKRNKSNVK